MLPAVSDASVSFESEVVEETELRGKRALIWLRKVVLPALSRPRRRMEYSGGC